MKLSGTVKDGSKSHLYVFGVVMVESARDSSRSSFETSEGNLRHIGYRSRG